MAEKTESSARVEIGLRAAIIAKAALEMLGMGPLICRLQIKEVEERVTESISEIVVAPTRGTQGGEHAGQAENDQE
jgi:hypothetical protein